MTNLDNPSTTKCLIWRPADLLYFIFFTSSIIFKLSDLVILLPLELIPTALLQFNQTWISRFKDPFMNVYDHQYPGSPGSRYGELMYFRTFVILGMCFQLPFYFYAARQIYKGQKSSLKIPGLIYCSHVITTVFPLLAVITNGLPFHTTDEKVALFLVYSVYLIIPLVLLYDLLTIERLDKNKKNN